jgi:acetolactate synthase-1/2/3 large subunit
MLMITGQKPIKNSKQGRFQIIDIVDLMRPITKFTQKITSGHNIPSQVREAFRLAEDERPGATHLELPEDIADEEISNKIIGKSSFRRPAPDAKSVQAAVERIQAAKRPLLLIGAGANRKQTSKMLTEFVNKLGIPFFSTQMGKGVVDERNPLFLGNATISSNDFLHQAIGNADLIINVGHDVVEKPPFFMDHGSFEVIHVNYVAASVDSVYYPQLGLIGDIANSAYQLKEKIMPQSHWDFEHFMHVKKHLEKHLLEGINDDRFPIYPQRLVADVRKVMPSDGIIALDNGVYKIWFARNYKAHEPNTVLLDNALATMGAGLPSAIMCKIVYPNRKVMAICGDGGFMMNSQELETAVRLKLDLVVIVINDNAYGMIKWKQAHMGFEEFGLNLGNPDFVKYAQSYGAHGHRVDKGTDVENLLEQCLATPGVHLVEVPIDYSDNDRILNQEIKEKSLLIAQQ